MTIAPLVLGLPAWLYLSACSPAAPVGQSSTVSDSSVVVEPDARRLADLQALAGAVADYQAATGELPVNFPMMVDAGMLEIVPTDPDGSNYDYTIIGDNDYELCAHFARNSSSEQSGDFWYHRSGHQCFRLNPIFGQY